MSTSWSWACRSRSSGRSARRSQRGSLGSHDLGTGTPLAVRAVRVLAQPVGALFSATIEHPSLQHLQRARLLLVDAGWRTLDWVVTSGGRILDKRTDSVAKSLFDVVDAIGRAIARDLGVQLGAADYARIDEALRRKESVRVAGTSIALEPYLPLGQRVADEAVTALRRLVQDGTDIDHIVLAGGGACVLRRCAGARLPEPPADPGSGRVLCELQGVPDRGPTSGHA